jgi:hypothetical protein
MPSMRLLNAAFYFRVLGFLPNFSYKNRQVKDDFEQRRLSKNFGGTLFAFFRFELQSGVNRPFHVFRVMKLLFMYGAPVAALIRNLSASLLIE